MNTWVIELRSADGSRSVLFLSFAAEEALAKEEARRVYPDLQVHSVHVRGVDGGFGYGGFGD